MPRSRKVIHQRLAGISHWREIQAEKFSIVQGFLTERETADSYRITFYQEPYSSETIVYRTLPTM